MFYMLYSVFNSNISSNQKEYAEAELELKQWALYISVYSEY